MRILVRHPGLFLVAAFLLAGSPASSQNDFRLKPGASGRICMDCHTSFEETMQLPVVHTAVAAGDCVGCHNPHAAKHGMLLSADANRICFECHDGIVPEQARSAHESAATGDCVACHDPHASPNENVLVRPGNQLCDGCHADIAAKVEADEFRHKPVEDGCLNCHTAHASKNSRYLLKQDEPALCTGCHDTTKSFFVSRHMNYPVGDARCTSCHDPHGSDNARMLWTSVHRPVTNGMCNQCHADASSPEPLALKKQGLDLCRGCHSSTVNQLLTRARPHWPALDQKACLNCHSPHASRTAGLLRQPTLTLCGECHEDTMRRQTGSVAQHQPMQDGECGTCHSPHASDNPFLLELSDVNELCGTCHDWESHSSHPIGAKVLDTRNSNLSVDCLSCHRAHGSQFEALSHYDPKMGLCVECHQDRSR